MKTERRHELQTNVLADHLGKGIVKVKPYTNLIVVALIAVVVAVVAWQVIAWKSSSGRGKAWDDFESARQQYAKATNELRQASTKSDNSDNPAMIAAVSKVDEVIKNYEGQPVAHWSQLLLGNHYQSVGKKQLFYNREDARTTLETAAGYFQEATAAEQPELKQRAYFGLGIVLECQGKLDEATTAYENAEQVWPAGPLSDTALAYAKRLKEPQSSEFYASYEKQKPQDARAAEAENTDASGLGKDLFNNIPGLNDGNHPRSPLPGGPFIPKVPVPTDNLPTDQAPTEKAPAEKAPAAKAPAAKGPDATAPANSESDPPLPPEDESTAEPRPDKSLPAEPDETKELPAAPKSSKEPATEPAKAPSE